MRSLNQSSISEFLLLGLSRQPHQQQLLFLFFLTMYLATVLGNLLIILAISTDSRLHTPMYFFLSNLSFMDICFSSTTVPKLNKKQTSSTMSVSGHVNQLCLLNTFFHFLFHSYQYMQFFYLASDLYSAFELLFYNKAFPSYYILSTILF
uniref:G-protein coupled receptors family 1 profile domain-containing protein n=1 Tax=Cavia porcellus TaxID=10141 RepID=A0A286XEV4_CAVPO